MVVEDVPAHQDESGTEAVEHGNELLKVGVGGVFDLAEPYVTDTDIERVVVADAAREGATRRD